MVKIALLLWLGMPGWIPARWDGGPMEVARRAQNRTAPADSSALAGWYDPSTLAVLDGTPINCLLLTFSADVDSEIEKRQHRLVQEYARAARERGIATLGLIHPGRDPSTIAAAADEVRLDGLVLEAGFPEGPQFAAKLAAALRSRKSDTVVIPIEQEPAAARTSAFPIAAVQGVRPSARDLADMGIRAGASAEPWIESNIWLVRSLRATNPSRPVWISQEPNPASPGDYKRCIADAAIAGGRWIVSLDDGLRGGLHRKDPAALAIWRGLTEYLGFAEQHADWRQWEPFGKVALVLDLAGKNSDFANEYLNLVARRHIPYRIVLRDRLTSASLARFSTVLAADVPRPTDAERKILQAFAEEGGTVIAGPGWGNAPSDSDYAEIPASKGRVIVYKDEPPDPETVARDMVDLLEPEATGLSLFNVPSVLTCVATDESGRSAVLQMLNYATEPFNSKITVRLKGVFGKARLLTAEGAGTDLTVRALPNNWTEFAIPKLAVWGAVVLNAE